MYVVYHELLTSEYVSSRWINQLVSYIGIVRYHIIQSKYIQSYGQFEQWVAIQGAILKSLKKGIIWNVAYHQDMEYVMLYT